MKITYVISVIIIAGAVTFLIRFIPFALFSNSKKNMPSSIAYLGGILPQAAIAILLIYCLKDVDMSYLGGFAPEVISLSAVVAVHLYKKNFILSIASGTVLYMVLIQHIFV